MPFTLLKPDGIDLSQTFAFTGTVTGTPSGLDSDDSWWVKHSGTAQYTSASVINMNTTEILGANCSLSSGRITVATAGRYQLFMRLSNQSAFSDNAQVDFRKNTTLQVGRIYYESNTEINYLGQLSTCIIQLSANDIVDCYGVGYFSGDTADTVLSYFAGVRLGD